MNSTVSRHYKTERNDREKLIRECLGGDGQIVDRFIVNKFHPRGKEIHELRDNGLIIIFNKNSGRLITKIIARKNQIERYYKNTNKIAPQWLLDLAEANQYNGLNCL